MAKPDAEDANLKPALSLRSALSLGEEGLKMIRETAVRSWFGDAFGAPVPYEELE